MRCSKSHSNLIILLFRLTGIYSSISCLYAALFFDAFEEVREPDLPRPSPYDYLLDHGITASLAGLIIDDIVNRIARYVNVIYVVISSDQSKLALAYQLVTYIDKSRLYDSRK